METLEAMRLFKTVTQAGSLSAAARSTGQSTASVSRKIARLEESVGAKLLNRTSRNLSLTTIGEVYLGRISVILDQIHNLNTAISEQQTVPRGVLNVKTSFAISEIFLSEALPSFLRDYPEITLHAHLSEDQIDLEGSMVHVDIRIGMPNDPELMIRRLSQGVERVLYASADYLAEHPKISGPQDLLAHNFITLHRASQEQVSLYCRTSAGVKEIPIHGNLAVNDTRTLHQAAISGLGLALLPAWMIADDLSTGKVMRILPDIEMTHTGFDHGIFAVFRRNDLILPKVRVFVDFLVETFRRKDSEISQIAMNARRQSVEHGIRAPDAMRWVHSGSLVRR